MELVALRHRVQIENENGPVPAAAAHGGYGKETPDPAPEKITVLFVGANNESTVQLKLRKECKAMETNFMLTKGTDMLCSRVTFVTDCFASADELMCTIRRQKPTVLHFGCHGDENGLFLFRSVVNNAALVNAIANYQQYHTPKIRLAVVNACLSVHLAQELSSHIDFVIGYEFQLKETVAQSFSSDLYHSLGTGCEPLLASFQSAKVAGQGSIGGYFLFAPRFSPEEFFLLSRLPADPHSPASASADSSDITAGLASAPAASKASTGVAMRERASTTSLELSFQPDEELRALLAKYGLEREADVIAQRLGVETVAELERVSAEDVGRDVLPVRAHKDLLTVLKMLAAEQQLAELSMTSTRSGASESDSDLDLDDTEDVCSSNSPQQGTAEECVMVHHPGSVSEFRELTNKWLKSWLEWAEWTVLQPDKAPSLCLLVLLECVRESAFRSPSLLMLADDWFQDMAAAPFEPATHLLDSFCRLMGRIHHPEWRVDCKGKKHGLCVSAIDGIVRKKGWGRNAGEWESEVIADWFDCDESNEEAPALLGRAEKFLRRVVTAGNVLNVAVLGDAVPVGSFVVFLRLHSAAALLLFSFLELNTRRSSTAAGPSGAAHGFDICVSSSGRAWGANRQSAPGGWVSRAATAILCVMARMDLLHIEEPWSPEDALSQLYTADVDRINPRLDAEQSKVSPVTKQALEHSALEPKQHRQEQQGTDPSTPFIYPLQFSPVASFSGSPSEGRNLSTPSPSHEQQRFEELLESVISFNEQDERGCTLVHTAAKLGHQEILAFLAEEGAHLEAFDNLSRTPAHFAAEFGQIGCLKFLAENNINVNVASKTGTTPAMLAALRGHVHCLDFLASQGCAQNARDNNGQSAVHLAAEGGQAEVLDFLLAKYPYADFNSPDKNRDTPSHIAAKHGHLLCLTVLACFGVDLDCSGRHGNRPVHEAVRHGHISCLDFLVREGVDVNAENDYGQTAVYFAAKSGFEDCLDVLRSFGANMNARENFSGYANTPAHVAASNGHPGCLKLLAGFGGDLDARTLRGDLAPAHCAAEGGHVQCLEILWRCGADLRLLDGRGLSCLDVAHAHHGSPQHAKIAQFLIENVFQTSVGADSDHEKQIPSKDFEAKVSQILVAEKDMSHKSDSGQGGMEVGSGEGLLDASRMTQVVEDPGFRGKNEQVVISVREGPEQRMRTKKLLAEGFSANSTHNGRGALHEAAAQGRAATLALLIANKADVNLRTHSKDTAAHFAVMSDSSACLLVLACSGADLSLQNLNAERPRDLALVWSKPQALEVLDFIAKHCVGQGLGYPEAGSHEVAASDAPTPRRDSAHQITLWGEPRVQAEWARIEVAAEFRTLGGMTARALATEHLLESCEGYGKEGSIEAPTKHQVLHRAQTGRTHLPSGKEEPAGWNEEFPLTSEDHRALAVALAMMERELNELETELEELQGGDTGPSDELNLRLALVASRIEYVQSRPEYLQLRDIQSLKPAQLEELVHQCRAIATAAFQSLSAQSMATTEPKTLGGPTMVCTDSTRRIQRQISLAMDLKQSVEAFQVASAASGCPLFVINVGCRSDPTGGFRLPDSPVEAEFADEHVHREASEFADVVGPVLRINRTRGQEGGGEIELLIRYRWSIVGKAGSMVVVSREEGVGKRWSCMRECSFRMLNLEDGRVLEARVRASSFSYFFLANSAQAIMYRLSPQVVRVLFFCTPVQAQEAMAVPRAPSGGVGSPPLPEGVVEVPRRFLLRPGERYQVQLDLHEYRTKTAEFDWPGMPNERTPCDVKVELTVKAQSDGPASIVLAKWATVPMLRWFEMAVQHWVHVQTIPIELKSGHAGHSRKDTSASPPPCLISVSPTTEPMGGKALSFFRVMPTTLQCKLAFVCPVSGKESNPFTVSLRKENWRKLMPWAKRGIVCGKIVTTFLRSFTGPSQSINFSVMGEALVDGLRWEEIVSKVCEKVRTNAGVTQDSLDRFERKVKATVEAFVKECREALGDEGEQSIPDEVPIERNRDVMKMLENVDPHWRRTCGFKLAHHITGSDWVHPSVETLYAQHGRNACGSRNHLYARPALSKSSWQRKQQLLPPSPYAQPLYTSPPAAASPPRRTPLEQPTSRKSVGSVQASSQELRLPRSMRDSPYAAARSRPRNQRPSSRQSGGSDQTGPEL